MDLSLKGRHALVCGASAGIGRAAAIELAKLGATVTVLSRTKAKLESLAQELKAAGAPAAHVLVADLDDRPGLRKTVAAHLEKHGTVHILINNQSGPHGGPILAAKEEEFIHAYGRIQLASHALVQLLAPGMAASGFGRIVNVLSTSVREPIPNIGVGNTVRASMASWAKTLSRELPPGVTINSVMPGFTDTERLGELASDTSKRTGKSVEEIRKAWIAAQPEGRLGRPEEIAAAIAFLCSPAASFIRGHVLAVDGGRLNAI